MTEQIKTYLASIGFAAIVGIVVWFWRGCRDEQNYTQRLREMKPDTGFVARNLPADSQSVTVTVPIQKTPRKTLKDSIRATISNDTSLTESVSDSVKIERNLYDALTETRESTIRFDSLGILAHAVYIPLPDFLLKLTLTREAKRDSLPIVTYPPQIIETAASLWGYIEAFLGGTLAGIVLLLLTR